MRKNSKTIKISAASMSKLEEVVKLSRVPLEQVHDDAVDCGLLSEGFETIYGPMIKFRQQRGKTLVEVFADEERATGSFYEETEEPPGGASSGASFGTDHAKSSDMGLAGTGDAGPENGAGPPVGDASFIERFAGPSGDDTGVDDGIDIRPAR